MTIGDLKAVVPDDVWKRSCAYDSAMDDKSYKFEGDEMDELLDREVVSVWPVNTGDLVLGIGYLVIHYRRGR